MALVALRDGQLVLGSPSGGAYAKLTLGHLAMVDLHVWGVVDTADSSSEFHLSFGPLGHEVHLREA